MKDHNKVSPESFVLWTDPALKALLHRRSVLDLWSSSWPTSGPTVTYQFFAVLEVSELDIVLKVKSSKAGVEGENHILWSTGHTCFEVHNRAGFVGSECALMGHIQLFIHQHPQVFLGRDTLNPFIPQSLLTLNIALAQAEDLGRGPCTWRCWSSGGLHGPNPNL